MYLWHLEFSQRPLLKGTITLAQARTSPLAAAGAGTLAHSSERGKGTRYLIAAIAPTLAMAGPMPRGNGQAAMAAAEPYQGVPQSRGAHTSLHIGDPRVTAKSGSDPPALYGGANLRRGAFPPYRLACAGRAPVPPTGVVSYGVGDPRTLRTPVEQKPCIGGRVLPTRRHPGRETTPAHWPSTQGPPQSPSPLTARAYTGCKRGGNTPLHGMVWYHCTYRGKSPHNSWGGLT